MTPLQDVLALLSGAAVGFTLSVIGGGGSILALPLLLYVVRYGDEQAVVGTTALAVAVTAFLNLRGHSRAGTVRWRPAITLAVPGVAGALVGSMLGRHLPARQLLFLFALLMLAVAWMMWRSARLGGGAAPDRSEGADHARACPVAGAGLGVGLLAGLFGIGGGFLVVPALMLCSRLSIVSAVGSSLVTVGALGLTTAASYAVTGQVLWLVAAEYIAGGAVGGMLGTRVAVRLGARRATLGRMFAVVIVGVATYMLALNAVALTAR